MASEITDDQIEAMAHRRAWRYKKSSDPHHSDTYTFNRATLLEFVRFDIAALASTTGEAEPAIWANFPCYLIDHCEGDTISEEGLQRALSDMLADPKYATTAAATPAAPGEVTDAQLLDLADDFKSTYQHGGTTFDDFDSTGFARAVLALSHPAPVAAPAPASEAVAERYCNKCGYFGPDQWHWKPNGSGECGYLSTPTQRAGDSVDAPVQQAGELSAFDQKTAQVNVRSILEPLGVYFSSSTIDAIVLAALKGEQPQPSGSERGEV